MLKPRNFNEQMEMPKFVGHRLDEALKQIGVTDDQLLDAIREAFNDKKWRYSKGKRFLITTFAQHIDLVPGQLIGELDEIGASNAEEGDDILTLVLPGES